MSKAEEFIKKNTNQFSNEDGFDYIPWLTPDHARKAVEIAREEVIEKAIGWIGEIYNYHEIMRYSDSCESSLGELTEWFKNYMKEGGKNE